MDLETIVAFLTPRARDWIIQQREMHRPAAVPLIAPVFDAVAPFYTSETLERARFRLVERIENPPFYSELAAIAPDIPLIDFREMAGITFDDTILVSRSTPHTDVTSLVFHELVHVTQYGKLGISDFASRYVRGWAENNMQYLAIPLERDAFELQERFEQHDQFSAEEAVVQQLSARGNAT